MNYLAQSMDSQVNACLDFPLKNDGQKFNNFGNIYCCPDVLSAQFLCIKI